MPWDPDDTLAAYCFEELQACHATTTGRDLPSQQPAQCKCVESRTEAFVTGVSPADQTNRHRLLTQSYITSKEVFARLKQAIPGYECRPQQLELAEFDRTSIFR